jgi:hypothetical protein
MLRLASSDGRHYSLPRIAVGAFDRCDERKFFLRSVDATAASFSVGELTASCDTFPSRKW